MERSEALVKQIEDHFDTTCRRMFCAGMACGVLLGVGLTQLVLTIVYLILW